MAKGMNSTDLKRLNRQTVFKMISRNKGISRMELSERTGLTKMTISNIMTEFLESELVCESAKEEHIQVGAGRKPLALCFSPNSPVTAGLLITRGKLRAIIADFHLSVLDYHEFVLQKNETAESIAVKSVMLLEALFRRTDRKVVGIGVSSIGGVDLKNGIVLSPPNFYGELNLPIVKILSERFHCPVVLQNDMNASALAELYFGRGESVDNFCYVGIGFGVGAGMVVERRLFEGTSGFSGEIGHMVINYNGKMCHCGQRGCLEAYVGLFAIRQMFREKLGFDVDDLYQYLEGLQDFCNSNPEGMELLDEVLEPLSVGLVNLCNTVDPRIIILGGGVGDFLPDPLMAKLNQMINEKMMGSGFRKINIVKSAFGREAPLMGAAVLILEEMYTGKISW